MGMSRKHYNEFARIIKYAKANHANGDPMDAINMIEQGLADICKEDNGAFQRDKFHNACELDKR